ncbi:MAG: hypothetical protein AAGH65_09935 [Pseudomonadota bacterium]
MTHNTQHELAHTLCSDSRMNFSFSKGITSWFDVDGLIISVWASNWTGREIVRIIDDHGERIVSNLRSFRFNTPHDFLFNGQSYQVRVVLGIGKARFELYREGLLIDADEFNRMTVQINPETGQLAWKQSFKKLLVPITMSFLGGLVFGYALINLLQWMFGS